MAIEHFSWGKGVSGGASGVLVRFKDKTGATSAVDLGYTRDGIDIDIELFYGVIKSDDWGGDEGPPADEQLLGGVVKLTTELVKFERAELEKLETFDFDGSTSSFGGTAGTQAPSIGSFIRQDGLYGILDLVGPSRTLRFATCFPRKRSFNVGTKRETCMVNWEAWMNSTAARKLWEELSTAS